MVTAHLELLRMNLRPSLEDANSLTSACGIGSYSSLKHLVGVIDANYILEGW